MRANVTPGCNFFNCTVYYGIIGLTLGFGPYALTAFFPVSPPPNREIGEPKEPKGSEVTWFQLH
jgi:hypothetical protein